MTLDERFFFLVEEAASSSTTLLRATGFGWMVTAGSPRLPDSVGPVVSTGLPRVALVWTTRDGDEDRRVVVIGLTSRRRTVHLASAMPMNFADAKLHRC
jgi:hypothetical protein